MASHWLFKGGPSTAQSAGERRSVEEEDGVAIPSRWGRNGQERVASHWLFEGDPRPVQGAGEQRSVEEDHGVATPSLPQGLLALYQLEQSQQRGN